MIKAAGNTELCELFDVEPKAQCIVCLSFWDIGIVYCTLRALLAKRNRGEQETCPVHCGSSLDSKLLHQERAFPRALLREEARVSRVLHRELAQEEMQEGLLGYQRSVHPRVKVPQEHV